MKITLDFIDENEVPNYLFEQHATVGNLESGRASMPTISGEFFEAPLYEVTDKALIALGELVRSKRNSIKEAVLVIQSASVEDGDEDDDEDVFVFEDEGEEFDEDDYEFEDEEEDEDDDNADQQTGGKIGIVFYK